DGNRAIGGVRAKAPDGSILDITLLGVRDARSGQYRCRVEGVDMSGRRSTPAVGSAGFNPAPTARPVHTGIKNGGTVDTRLGAPVQPPALRCGWVRGSVTRRHGDRDGSLAMGDPIAPGDVVATGANSAAILVLGDRSVAVMRENSDLTLPAQLYNGAV